MQNLKDKNVDQKDSPSALGMEEMNSMIKSFQELVPLIILAKDNQPLWSR